tara:strand:- start:1514 stop:2383 length:870 start_codon:yes stop_codon:yes gene_type:complete
MGVTQDVDYSKVLEMFSLNDQMILDRYPSLNTKKNAQLLLQIKQNLKKCGDDHSKLRLMDVLEGMYELEAPMIPHLLKPPFDIDGWQGIATIQIGGQSFNKVTFEITDGAEYNGKYLVVGNYYNPVKYGIGGSIEIQDVYPGVINGLLIVDEHNSGEGGMSYTLNDIGNLNILLNYMCIIGCREFTEETGISCFCDGQTVYMDYEDDNKNSKIKCQILGFYIQKNRLSFQIQPIEVIEKTKKTGAETNKVPLVTYLKKCIVKNLRDESLNGSTEITSILGGSPLHTIWR